MSSKPLTLEVASTYSRSEEVALLICLCTFALRMRWLSYWQRLNSKANEPPTVPYLIPWLGSCISCKLNFLKFIYYCSDYLDTKIFRIYNAGKIFIIVTDPFVAALIIGGKYPQLSWQHVKLKVLCKSGGISKTTALLISKSDGAHKTLARHIGKPTCLNSTLLRYQKVFHDQISSLIRKEESIRWVENEILEFVSRAVFFFSIDTLFGLPALATEEDFKLMMKYNSRFDDIISINFLSRYRLQEELGARESLVSRIKSSLLEIENFPGYRTAETFKGIDDNDMSNPKASDLDTRARRLFLLFHASILNTAPTLFWVIYYLLSDKAIYDAVQEEIDIIYDTRTKMNKANQNNENDTSLPHLFELADLHNMHKLDSLITEVFRLKTTSRSLSSRIATEDFKMILPVDGEEKQFFVEKGTIFITSPTIKHTDESIFKDATTFKWDRFVPLPDGTRPTFFKDGRILRTPVTPFGGGKTHCPGRYFAIAEMKLIVSLMLIEYDVRFKDGKKPAQPELRNPRHISNGTPKTDITIEVRRRLLV